MFKRFSFYVFFLSLVVMLNAYTALPGDREAGERIRQEVLAWLDSFNSLQCTYTHRWDMPTGEWKEEEVSFRWQDAMAYCQTTTIGWGGVEEAEPIGSLMQESLVDGKATLLGQQGVIVMGEKNHEELQFSQSTLLLQYLLLKGQLGNTGLYTLLSRPGNASLLERNGERVLMYWSTDDEVRGKTVNLYLDKQNRVSQIDFIQRPFCSYEEVERLTKMDIYDLFYLERSLELLDYRQFSGVWFPCYFREITSVPTKESVDRQRPLHWKADHGEMEYCEYYVRRLEIVECEPNSPTSEIHIKPETVIINQILEKSDFEIEIPMGTGMVNAKTGKVFKQGEQTWRERHANLILFMAMLLLFSIATVVGWRYWSPNDAAR